VEYCPAGREKGEKGAPLIDFGVLLMGFNKERDLLQGFYSLLFSGHHAIVNLLYYSLNSSAVNNR
jgi:hypothetical protein